MDSAIVFPGMSPTRFSDLARFLLIDREARALVAAADEVLGHSLFDRYRDESGESGGSGGSGDYAESSQVVFLVSCLAMARWAHDHLGARPGACVGPSFGGKAAAVWSGALDFADAVAVTVRMARCEQEYFTEHHTDVVTHSFTRMPADALAGVLRALDERGEWHEVSCHVDDDFFMVSLRDSVLPEFQAMLRAAGGLSFYTMRPPLHCSVFGGLRDRVEAEALAGVEFNDPRVPIVADSDGSLVTTADGVRTMLLDGVTRTVRWPAAVATLRELGVRTLHIAGQDAIFGRVRGTTRHFDVVAATPRLALTPRRRGQRTAAAASV